MVDQGLLFRTDSAGLTSTIRSFVERREVKHVTHAESVIEEDLKQEHGAIVHDHDIKEGSVKEEDIAKVAKATASIAKKLFSDEFNDWMVVIGHLKDADQIEHKLLSEEHGLRDEESAKIVREGLKEVKHLKDEILADLQAAKKITNGIEAVCKGEFDGSLKIRNWLAVRSEFIQYWKDKRSIRREAKQGKLMAKETEWLAEAYEHLKGRAKGKDIQKIRKQLPGKLQALYKHGHTFCKFAFRLFKDTALTVKRMLNSMNVEEKDFNEYIQDHFIPNIMYRTEEQHQKEIRDEWLDTIHDMWKEESQLEGMARAA